MGARTTRRLRQILGWTSRLLLFALCLEVAARVDDRISQGAPLWGRYDADRLRQIDPSGIPRNVPGARFEKWKINSLGFRGAEIARDKPPGRRRVVCLGQSESFGLYESEGGEWPARLGRLLSSTHPEVDVINASVAGTGRRTRKAYLENYLLPLQPDVVVLYFNVFNEATEGLGGFGADTDDAAGRGEASSGGVMPQLRALEKLKLRIKEAIPQSVTLAMRSWTINRQLRQLVQSVLRGRRPIDVLPEDNVASFEKHLREMVRFLESKGIRPVVATYPTLVHAENRDRYLFYLSAERIYRVWFSEQGLIDIARKLNDVSRRVASELEVPLVEADDSIPKTTEYFADDVHYTDKGAELIAERILDTMERAGALQ